MTSLFIENAFNKSKAQINTYRNEHIGFNNFTPREYDYDALEKKLLGLE